MIHFRTKRLILQVLADLSIRRTMKKLIALALLLLPLQGYCLDAYHFTQREIASLKWIYPDNIVSYVLANTWVEDFPADLTSISYFTAGQGIFVNSRKVERFRYALICVHEAFHVLQNSRGKRLVYTPPGGGYYVDLQLRKIPTDEQQAEIARLLAIDHTHFYYKPVQINDELLVQFDVYVRWRLWALMQSYGLKRPDDWDQ